MTHSNYYQLMALRNNADEPSLELPGSDFESRWQANLQQADRLQQELPEKWPIQDTQEVPGQHAIGESHLQPELSLPIEESLKLREQGIAAAFANWLRNERSNAARWQIMKPVEAHASLPTLTFQADDSIFVSGDTAKRDDYFVSFAAVEEPVTALRLEALPDERLPARGPGTTYDEGTLGDFYLTELHARSFASDFAFAFATETYAKNRFGSSPATAAMAIDGDAQSGWAVHDRQGERHVAVFVLRHPVPAGTPLHLQMTFGRHFAVLALVPGTLADQSSRGGIDRHGFSFRCLRRRRGLRPQPKLTCAAFSADGTQLGLCERGRQIFLFILQTNSAKIAE